MCLRHPGVVWLFVWTHRQHMQAAALHTISACRCQAFQLSGTVLSPVTASKTPCMWKHRSSKYLHQLLETVPGMANISRLLTHSLRKHQ